MSNDPPPSPPDPLFAIAGISQVAAPPEPILNVATFENGEFVVRHIPAPAKLPKQKLRRGRPREAPIGQPIARHGIASSTHLWN
jgi:hypothetical protein